MSAILPLDGMDEESGEFEERDVRQETVSVLVVDDEPGMRHFLERALSKRCALLETAASVEEAEALRQRAHFDIMVVDICLPGKSGIDWLEELRQQGNRADVIMMTAYADLDTAIKALRAGASDFVLKPFRLDQIITSFERSLERRRMERENYVLKREVGNYFDMEGMIGNSSAMREIGDIMQRVAVTRSTVLIEGESGTGKELVARSIHAHSGRKGPFVPVNCGAISPELLESELFGHTKGAFTGAGQARDGLFNYADGGTLFLDEIGEMPLAMQSKLLRVLEERKVRPVGSEKEVPVDVRVLTATNRDLAQEVQEGNFREDLFYRLNVLTVTMPPLRERPEDIPHLANYFTERMSSEMGLAPIPFSHDDLRCMQSYEWPGNVRELKNVIERCMLLGKLPGDCCGRSPSQSGSSSNAIGNGYPLSWTLEQVEKQHMLRVLEEANNNKSEAARRLGVSRKTMERKIQAWSQDG